MSKVPPGRRRLARALAALSESSKYVQYENDPPPCDRTHQTPSAPPFGRTALLSQHALARTDLWIQDEERRAAEHARRRPPPPPPDWAVQAGERGKPKMAHTSACWNPFFMRGITRAQAIESLTRGGVPPCPQCEPDKEPGVLD
ncbi:DUF6233 domain-containing protein [Streptomyces sp. NBC_01508]|uniref:DUF6233 domain-containing protein n=1 Tax=Streptomyces sp. NBC_01508 TaxID=2903888 RepID=UPI00386EACD7